MRHDTADCAAAELIAPLTALELTIMPRVLEWSFGDGKAMIGGYGRIEMSQHDNFYAAVRSTALSRPHPRTVPLRWLQG